MPHDASVQQTPIEDRTVTDRPLAPAGDSARPSVFAVIGAELFGTFLLVFVGLGIALYATLSGAGVLGVALGFGVALMAGMASVGHISGGHFNPAVTLGYAVAGRTSWKDVPVYWVAQIVGAVAAAAALFTTVPKTFASGDGAAYGSLKEFFSVTANGFGEHSPSFVAASTAFFKTFIDQGVPQSQIDDAIASGQLPVPAFAQFEAVSVGIIEVVATALFVGVILAVTDKRARIRFTPVVVGLTFGLLLLLAAPLSGGSLNPARSLAAALFSDGWALESVWIFWAAPLAGAAIAALFYRGFTTAAPVVEYVYLDDTGDIDDDGDAVTDLAVEGDELLVTTEVEEILVVTEVVTSTPDTAVSETATEPSAPAQPATGETLTESAPIAPAPAETPVKAPAKKPAAKKAPVVARKAPVKKAPATSTTPPSDATTAADATDDDPATAVDLPKE